VLSRVCAHRGLDVIAPEYGHQKKGNCNQYRCRCPYHHWIHGLGEKLKGAPFMKDYPELASKYLGLHAFNSAVWKGFVNVSADTQPIDEQFGGLEKYLGLWLMKLK
jgi:phenylpropionate dioxygenase-like ring-hydroxylating dioxygenase large terminal subunit